MKSKTADIVRDGCGAGIAFSAASICANAASTESDSLTLLFSELAYQGVVYDAASYVGVALGAAMAASFATKMYKQILE